MHIPVQMVTTPLWIMNVNIAYMVITALILKTYMLVILDGLHLGTDTYNVYHVPPKLPMTWDGLIVLTAHQEKQIMHLANPAQPLGRPLRVVQSTGQW
jgi:hypothetical protein